MKQQEFGLNLSAGCTRKMSFLALMNNAIPWCDVVAQLTAVTPPKLTGWPLFGREVMLCLHLLQQLVGLSDFAMEEALFETPLHRSFAELEGNTCLPDRISILRLRHLLERHHLALQFFEAVNTLLRRHGLMLQSGTVVAATIIAAPGSTKNSRGKRDPQMDPTKKGNQWDNGMKSQIGADAQSGLVHSVVGTAANVNDVTQIHALVHGSEAAVYADAGYQGGAKRTEAQGIDVNWHVTMRPSKRRALDKISVLLGVITDRIEQLKASIRAKVRVFKRQFGCTKVPYRGLAMNTGWPTNMLFPMINLWMCCRVLCKGRRNECVWSIGNTRELSKNGARLQMLKFAVR